MDELNANVMLLGVKVTEIALIIIVCILFVTNFIQLACFMYIVNGQ